jgi:hypothetical protein
MTRLTEDLLQAIVTKAVLDKDFRNALISSVSKGGPSLGIPLDETDIAELKKLLPDLERFGGLQGLHADDAKNWTIGLFEIKDLHSHGPHPRR